MISHHARAERFGPLAQLALAASLAVFAGALLPTWPTATVLVVSLSLLYLWVMADWRRGVLALLVVLPFAGIPAFLMNSNYTLIARDVAIGAPLYCSLLVAVITGREYFRLQRTSLPLVVLFFAVVVIVHVLLAPSLLIGLVGAKVWLFYIPMIAVGYQFVRSAGDALRVLKITALLAVIPASLGIAEWIVTSRTGDLGPFRGLYGSLTQNVNGQYVKTSEIRFSRIPSTFTSVSQYVSFCYVALTASLAVALAQRSLRWMGIVALVGLASLTSGARGALLIAPLLILLGVVFSGVRVHRAVVAVLATAAIVGGLIANGTDVHAYRHELSAVAAVDGAHAVGEFDRSLRRLMGDGTGSHTNAALRYGGGTVDQMVENWYGRAGAELGIAGLALAICLLVLVAAAARKASRRLTGVSRDIGGPIAALALITALISFKGSILDVDPYNVYFWLLFGILLKIQRIAASERSTDSADA